MKTIYGLIFIIGSITTQAACGENKAVTAAKAMANAVCACRDLACAQKATSDGSARLMEIARSANGTEEDAHKIIAESERSASCVAKLGAK